MPLLGSFCVWECETKSGEFTTANGRNFVLSFFKSGGYYFLGMSEMLVF
jgi:hypothetical protein